MNDFIFKIGKKINFKDETFTQLIGGFGDSNPIITIKQIAKLLALKDKVINQTINRNIQCFIQNVHIIDIKNSVTDSDPLYETLLLQGYTKQSIANSKNIYVLSQAGFLLYLKFAEGDRAVELYKNFIEDYFKTKAENKVMKRTLTEEKQFLTDTRKTILGSMFMETDEKKRMEFFYENERIAKRISEIEIVLSNKELAQQIQEKVQDDLTIADTLTNSNKLYDMGTFSKVLNMKGLGRNNFFEWLRDNGILMSNNTPYQRYMDYFKVVQTVNKRKQVFNKTMVKSKGIKYIFNQLIKDGKIIPKTIDEVLTELNHDIENIA